MLTSYQFEVAAKNAVIDIMRNEKDIEINIDEIDFSWFGHILGTKKCQLWGPKMQNYLAEVTYNNSKHEMYVDIYDKESNRAISEDDLSFDTSRRSGGRM